MTDEQSCKSCEQRHDCQKIYRQLADFKGPSVAVRVFVAFLLPLFVFAASLAILQKTLAGTIENKDARTAICFALAAAVTFAVILLIRLTKKS